MLRHFVFRGLFDGRRVERRRPREEGTVAFDTANEAVSLYVSRNCYTREWISKMGLTEIVISSRSSAIDRCQRSRNAKRAGSSKVRAVAWRKNRRDHTTRSKEGGKKKKEREGTEKKHNRTKSNLYSRNVKIRRGIHSLVHLSLTYNIILRNCFAYR